MVLFHFMSAHQSPLLAFPAEGCPSYVLLRFSPVPTGLWGLNGLIVMNVIYIKPLYDSPSFSIIVEKVSLSVEDLVPVMNSGVLTVRKDAFSVSLCCSFI